MHLKNFFIVESEGWFVSKMEAGKARAFSSDPNQAVKFPRRWQAEMASWSVRCAIINKCMLEANGHIRVIYRVSYDLRGTEKPEYIAKLEKQMDLYV